MLLPLTLGVLATLPLAVSPDGGDPVEPKRGLVRREPAACEGYTLFAPLRSTQVYLVDLDGELVHRWETGSPTAAHAELLDDGSILRASRDDENPRFSGGGLGGKLQRFSWDGELVWEFVLSDSERAMHHEYELLPDGNVIAIVWEHVPRDRAVALGRPASQVGERGWWPDVLVEIRPTLPRGGEIVWEWHAEDHLVQDFDRAKAGFGDVTAHPERFDVNFDHRDEPPLSAAERAEREAQEREMRALGYAGGQAAPAKPDEPDPDWMHTNSVHHHAGHDLLVLSSPRLDEVWILDHSTTSEEARGSTGGRWKRGGDVLWRWGNPANWGGGARDAQRLFGQHDARFVAGEGLRLSVFNNGLSRPGAGGGKWSSVDELVLPFDPARGFLRADGADFGPRELAWTYEAPERESLYSFFISGAERLANGNTLICSGAQGRFLEVTRDGELAWEYLNPYGGEIEHSFGKTATRPSRVEPHAVFRCARYAPSHPGLARLAAR